MRAEPKNVKGSRGGTKDKRGEERPDREHSKSKLSGEIGRLKRRVHTCKPGGRGSTHSGEGGRNKAYELIK